MVLQERRAQLSPAARTGRLPLRRTHMGFTYIICRCPRNSNISKMILLTPQRRHWTPYCPSCPAW